LATAAARYDLESTNARTLKANDRPWAAVS
jgi:hypothetical protein